MSALSNSCRGGYFYCLRCESRLGPRISVSAPPFSDGEKFDVGRQLSFDELDTPLSETTFVVVDLETTGGSADQDSITEIGAVKIRGGEVLGEMATLVDPGRSIPPT